MFKLLFLILVIYLLYQAYATYKARGDSVNPLDDFLSAYLERIQFWK